MIRLIEDIITKQDIDSLIKWLGKYPRLTKGELTEQFEKEFSEYQGCKYSVYVNSGSSANLLMAYVLNKLNDTNCRNVIIPSLSWITTLSPFVQFGFKPILCDSSYGLGLNIKHLERLLKRFKVLAVVACNVLGIPCDYNAIKELCKKYNAMLIEDNCESLGSVYNGIKCGNFGEMSTFSFYYGHHISTIEGGMICTNNEYMYRLLKMYRSHGWSRDLNITEKKILQNNYNINDFDAMYTFYEWGFNVRSTDLQAFIGLRQIPKIESIVKKRYENFLLYDQLIKNDYWKIEFNKTSTISNFAYPVIHPKRDKIVKELIKNEIECRPLIAGNLARQPVYIDTYDNNNECKFSDTIHKYGMYVPNHQALNDKDIYRICEIINGVIN